MGAKLAALLAKAIEWLKNITALTDLVQTLLTKCKGIASGVPSSFLNYLKKTWILWGVIAGAVFLYHDVSQFDVILLLMAPIAAVLLVVERLLDSRAGWGLFPEMDFLAAIKNAMSDPLSCALLCLGVCGIFIAFIIAAALTIHP